MVNRILANENYVLTVYNSNFNDTLPFESQIKLYKNYEISENLVKT